MALNCVLDFSDENETLNLAYGYSVVNNGYTEYLNAFLQTKQPKILHVHHFSA